MTVAPVFAAAVSTMLLYSAWLKALPLLCSKRTVVSRILVALVSLVISGSATVKPLTACELPPISIGPEGAVTVGLSLVGVTLIVK
ncbi:hypothetical protein D3C75_472800 [compost metagenome]